MPATPLNCTVACEFVCAVTLTIFVESNVDVVIVVAFAMSFEFISISVEPALLPVVKTLAKSCAVAPGILFEVSDKSR